MHSGTSHPQQLVADLIIPRDMVHFLQLRLPRGSLVSIRSVYSHAP